jgi:DNA primase
MNQTISKEDVELCRRVPLHRLVGSTNVTKKIKIICPFHKEHTASCQIFPDGGYKCYGCPAKGNSVDFIVNMGATFEEAINELKKYI